MRGRDWEETGGGNSFAQPPRPQRRAYLSARLLGFDRSPFPLSRYFYKALPSHLNFPFCSQYEMRTEARRKNLLILILHYLTQEGYVITVIYGDAPPLWPFKSRNQTLLLEQLKMSRKYSDSMYTLSPPVSYLTITINNINIIILILFVVLAVYPRNHSTTELQPVLYY